MFFIAGFLFLPIFNNDGFGQVQSQPILCQRNIYRSDRGLPELWWNAGVAVEPEVVQMAMVQQVAEVPVAPLLLVCLVVFPPAIRLQ